MFKSPTDFPCGNESVIRRRCWKNSAGRQHSQSGWSCRGPLRSSVLEFGFRLGSLVQYRQTYLTLHVLYIYIYSLQLAYNSTGVGSTGTQLGVVLEHVSKKMFKYLQEIKRFLVTSAEAYQFCCDCSSVTTLQFKYMRQR